MTTFLLTTTSPANDAELMYRLQAHLNPGTISELDACTERLIGVLLQRGAIEDAIVLAMYGGGKDSSYMVAAARYVQIAFRNKHGKTFTLRVVTNRHAGMPQAVLENIQRAYVAMEFFNDPQVELLIVNGNSIVPYAPGAVYPDAMRQRDRMDVLMSGHRCQGDPRPSFCNRCNLGMENGLAMGIGYGGQADVVLSGDSFTEQRHYIAWVRHAVHKLNAPVATGTPGLKTFLSDLEHINYSLSKETYGNNPDDIQARRLSLESVQREPLFFNIYEDTSYRVGDHWELISDFMGFQFDEIAFSFSESDCGNPGVMAHLNGLRHERALGSTYEEGIAEYKGFAIGLMRRKDFPDHLVEVMESRYASPHDVLRMRSLMDKYATETFGLSEENLICMLFSPFTEGGKNLSAYLRAEKPFLLPFEADILRILSGDEDPGPFSYLAGFLTAISGLQISRLRHLFRSSLVPTRVPGAPGKDPFSIILSGDPHKTMIERKDAEGSVVREQLSGR